MRRLVELASAVGAPAIVACLRPDVAAWARREVPPELGLFVENHWDQLLARTRDVRRATASAPGLRATLDTGHAALAGERPHVAATRLGPLLAHVHLKDARVPPLAVRAIGRRARARLLSRPRPVSPGEGDLDVRALRRALTTIGFAGVVSVEYEGRDPEPALRELVRRWDAAAPGAGERGPSG